MGFKKSVLSNGVRVITSEMPQMKSVATTVYVKAGSRYETVEQGGISHFLEHMLFKGTKKYPNQAEIAKAIEGVGGQINAWTDQDHTAYYSVLPSEFSDRSFDVLSEMIFNSLLGADAIEREKGVILEEINRRNDDPATYVFEHLIGLMWPGHPLGRPILGTRENVSSFQVEDFRNYMSNLYNSKSLVVSVAGNIRHEEVVSRVRKLFSEAKIGEQNKPELTDYEQSGAQVTLFEKKTDQAHLALGVRALSYSDPDRYVWNLINTILGQGMSSRLFLTIREEKGLAYNIYSFNESLQETGATIVHAGLNLGKLEEAVKAICEEFSKFKNIDVPEDELRKAKDFTKGMINLSMDDTDNVSNWYGRQELLMTEVLSPDQVIDKIERVTVEDIKRVAGKIFREDNLNLAVIAPNGDEGQLKGLLKV